MPGRIYELTEHTQTETRDRSHELPIFANSQMIQWVCSLQ